MLGCQAPKGDDYAFVPKKREGGKSRPTVSCFVGGETGCRSNLILGEEICDFAIFQRFWVVGFAIRPLINSMKFESIGD